jgi:hypothetical protein
MRTTVGNGGFFLVFDARFLEQDLSTKLFSRVL